MNSPHKPEAALRLDGEMTIYRAAELKPTLLAALTGAHVLALDLAGVTDIDSAGIQLLALAKKTLAEHGGTLRICAQSDAVTEVLALLNLADHFDDADAGTTHGAPERSSSTPSTNNHVN